MDEEPTKKVKKNGRSEVAKHIHHTVKREADFKLLLRVQIVYAGYKQCTLLVEKDGYSWFLKGPFGNQDKLLRLIACDKLIRQVFEPQVKVLDPVPLTLQLSPEITTALGRRKMITEKEGFDWTSEHPFMMTPNLYEVAGFTGEYPLRVHKTKTWNEPVLDKESEVLRPYVSFFWHMPIESRIHVLLQKALMGVHDFSAHNSIYLPKKGVVVTIDNDESHLFYADKRNKLEWVNFSRMLGFDNTKETVAWIEANYKEKLRPVLKQWLKQLKAKPFRRKALSDAECDEIQELLKKRIKALISKKDHPGGKKQPPKQLLALFEIVPAKPKKKEAVAKPKKKIQKKKK